MNDPNTIYKSPLLISAMYINKVSRNSPHTYTLLPSLVWVVFFGYCQVRQSTRFSVCRLDDGEYFVSQWMIQIRYINQLY